MYTSVSLLNCKVINKKAWLALQMIQLTFAFKTGTNQPPLTNNRDVNSFIIAKAQIDANLWKLWHSSIDLGPGFRSFFVQEALVSYCSIWLMDLFCSHSVYYIASLPKLENNGRKGPKKFRLFWYKTDSTYQVLQLFLVIFLKYICSSFTKVRFRWSFLGA